MEKINKAPFYIKLLAVILISCLGIIVYSNAFNCSFHFDDNQYIVENPFIKNIQNLLKNHEFYPCRFITFFTFALSYHLYGLNEFGYHLFNLAVHLGSAILVWWLTLLTLSTPAMKGNKITRHADLIALFTGLVFVSHPVQTEAVTYIWQRTASLAALIYLASVCLYVQSRLLPTGPLQKFCYISSLIMAVTAMFTKEMTITLPLMILFYEICFLKTKEKLDRRSFIPFFLTLLIIPLTIFITRSAQEKLPSDHISSIQYFLTQLRVMVTYIRLLFLPFNQNLDYDYPIFKSILEMPVLISILFLVGILYFAKYQFSKHRIVSFSICWFFLTLLPESSFLPFKDVIFEHRLYLPLVGYSMFLVSVVYYLFGKNSLKTMVIVLTLIITYNSILTYQRNKIWKDEITLLGDTVRKSPHKARPHYGLGVAYTRQGDLTDALSEYNIAIELDPVYADAYSARGAVYNRQGKLIEALSDYNKAIELRPDFPEAYYNLGIFFDKQNNFSQALSLYSKAIELDPNLEESYYNRGNIYARQGEITQAISDYSKVIELNPDDSKAYLNRGNSYSLQGQLPQALVDFNRAIELNPKLAAVYSNRAVVYYRIKEYSKAWEDAHHAEELGLTINPTFINALKITSDQNRQL